MPSLVNLANNAFHPVAGSGGAAAPVAGTAVATISSGSLPAGLYRFHVYTKADATGAEEPLDHNMDFRAGATVLAAQLLSSRQRGGYRAIGRPVQLDGSTAVTVNATANATASTTYRATILVERLA